MIMLSTEKHSETKTWKESVEENVVHFYVVCWHCGKKVHLSTERWSNPKNKSGSGGTHNNEGKGKPVVEHITTASSCELSRLAVD